MTELKKNIDYHSTMRKLATSYPVLNEVIINIVFWVISFVLMSVIIFFARHSIIAAFQISVHLKLWPYVLDSAIMGIMFGGIMGVVDYYFHKKIFQDISVGKIILLKAILSLVILLLVFIIRRYVLFNLVEAPVIHNERQMNSSIIWIELFEIMLIYTAFMSVVLSFMKEVNKKFGPGILVPLLLGQYRKPKEQERIFMFMDLKSSTSIAETIGHSKYSSFIRDAFIDINKVLADYNAEVYQYVGDEIVISWRTEEGLKDAACVNFFFACEKQLKSRERYYKEQYGMVPSFKASLHIGKVIAVEIGEVKRDIAYHGDTLNTASRIQSMCNEFHKKLLVSDAMVETGILDNKFKTEHLGNVILKGKTIPVGIISIES